jgi:autotransporter family porin
VLNLSLKNLFIFNWRGFEMQNYGNLLIFSLVLLGLIVIFSCGVSNVSAAGNTVYVNATGGHDSSTGTSWLLAKKSIKNATATATADGTVNIANGNYTGINNTQITLNKNINIIGQSKTGTIINGTGTNWIFHINSGIKVNIRNVLLTNGTANSGGAITNYGDLTVYNTSFTGNRATASNSFGGAIYSFGHLSLANSVFTSNTATVFGGAICIDSNILDLSNSVFTKNTAGYYGGAISNTYGVLDVKNSIFTSNNAINNGGAIYNLGDTRTALVTISGSNFTSNYANYGGAIYSDSILNVTNSIFKSNTASESAYAGGAIANDGTLNVNNSNFTDNNASKGIGGAITTAGELIINNSTFVGNNANGYSGGGAIYNYIKCIATINYSTFTDNTANSSTGGYGGAIFNYGTLNVTSSNFNDNIATKYGGAIFNDDTLYVTGCNFIDNSVTAIMNYGGAIYNYGTANVHFNRIVGNTASTGSAIYNALGVVDASLNWWGDNNDPIGKISGLTVNKWLILTITANPTTIGNGGFSLITADLKHDNTKTLQTGGYVPDGIRVSFITTLGTMGTPSSMVNGISHATLHAGTVSGPATVSAKLDNQTVKTSVKIIDTIPPKISSTTPTNLKTGVNRWATTSIKFNELIKNSSYFYKITIKNLTTSKYSTLTKTIIGNTLNLKTSTKTPNTWYQVTIPKAAIKDYAGNNLQANYTFKFKTGP